MARRLPSVGFTLEDLPDKTKNERVIEKRKVTKLFTSSIVSPFITSSPVLLAEEGTVYTYALAATGSAPIEWVLIDSVYPSLSIDRDSGVITWISPVLGKHLIKVRGTNSSGMNEQAYTLTVTAAALAPESVFQGGDTGLIFGGDAGAESLSSIDFFKISTGGAAATFGSTRQAVFLGGAASNGVAGDRVLHAGGIVGLLWRSAIDVVAVSAHGDAKLFGQMAQLSTPSGTVDNASNDRGIFGAGMTGTPIMSSVMEYVTVSASGHGNMASSFGNLMGYRRHAGGISNGINDRGIYAGGGSPVLLGSIEYITISTTADAVSFGTMESTEKLAACSNSDNERALLVGGMTSGAIIDKINFITISTAGDAAAFGVLSTPRQEMAATSNGLSDRAVVVGGEESSLAIISTMSYTMISTGNSAVDFAELTTVKKNIVGVSNGM